MLAELGAHGPAASPAALGLASALREGRLVRKVKRILKSSRIVVSNALPPKLRRRWERTGCNIAVGSARRAQRAVGRVGENGKVPGGWGRGER